METYLLFSLTGEKVDGRKNAVGFRLWIRCHRLWHWNYCQSRPQFSPLDTKRQTWQWNRCYGRRKILLGRAKKKRVAKRRKRMFNRNSFVGARFYNVKYQASIMTDCNYRDANIIGVDYFNCNMRGTSFKNAKFKNVVFFNCNLKGVDFTGTKFENVTFICTNLKNPKNLDLDNPEIRILRTYRPIDIDGLVENRLLAVAQNDSIFNAKVLHVSKNKLNQWTLSLIYEKYGLDGITMLSKILGYKEKWNNMYTVFSC
ncbi:pentapeptide repeat-containing protein [[Clostridium] innocuum]|uniref:pentapeptide repeat-containing protein n=1 Tax=Clostridium innocuum TaxID=1522 RepID=UPI001C434A99|nr:pentapeptide repeat-containing protein [[Clostridium] innocuum]